MQNISFCNIEHDTKDTVYILNAQNKCFKIYELNEDFRLVVYGGGFVDLMSPNRVWLILLLRPCTLAPPSP